MFFWLSRSSLSALGPVLSGITGGMFQSVEEREREREREREIRPATMGQPNTSRGTVEIRPRLALLHPVVAPSACTRVASRAPRQHFDFLRRPETLLGFGSGRAPEPAHSASI